MSAVLAYGVKNTVRFIHWNRQKPIFIKKKLWGLMNSLLRYTIILLLTWQMPWALATEPLFDQLTVDTESGQIFPEKCCWLALPESELLRSARRAQNCTAIGGPVGQYTLSDDKIWLTGLYKCGGGIPLKTIFPNLPDPAMAEWQSGKFNARVGYLCRNKTGSSVYKREITLVVQRGIVLSRDETVNDDSTCAQRN